MTESTSETPTATRAERLSEIAVQVGDAWLRGRGPLTGLKRLVAAQAEAVELGAPHEYLDCFDNIVQAARVLQGKSFHASFRDAPRVLERDIPRLAQAAAQIA